jgi:ribosome maturation factor RimP
MKHSQFNKKEMMQKLMPVVEHTCVKYSLIPLEVSFTKENGRWFLRIFIHKNHGSITLDDCENLTRGIGDYLDELIPMNYHLEISSPGLDRKLKTPMEYIVFKGKKATLKLKKPTEEFPEKVVEMKIIDYNNLDGLIFEDLKDGKQHKIKEDNIALVQLIVE